MHKKITILAMLLLFIVSCGKKVYTPLTAEVAVLSEEKHKTIELRCLGYGDSKDAAVGDSERKAFEIIFFRGIPNTSLEKPLIGSNEAALTAKHRSYFNSFFNNGRYRSFVMSSYVSSPYQKRESVFTGTVDIKINLMSLKKDLEDNNVIRKFGL
jgi:hypothetical protein